MVERDDFRVEVRNDEANTKYDAWLGDDLVGMIVYGKSGGRYVLTHAAVLPEFQGHGVGHQLISGTLDDIRSQGSRITVICPVVREFIDRHPEYEDLIDPEHPGVRSKAAPAG